MNGAKLKIVTKLTRFASCKLPTEHGTFDCLVYQNGEGHDHLVLIMGKISFQEPVLCRVHSECLTSEVLGSLKCDCKGQLELALKTIAQKGTGIFVYLRQEGRGIGLANKIRAYGLQDQGLNTLESNTRLGLPVDARNYAEAAFILHDLGVKSVELMTNNPLKVQGLKKFGIHVSKRINIVPKTSAEAKHYLRTKRLMMGHLIAEQELALS